MRLLLAAAGIVWLAELSVAQDTSPPCIKECYDDNGPPSYCESTVDAGEDIDDTVLARCTCSSLTAIADRGLYSCLSDCPDDELKKYLEGFTEESYSCADLFPGVDIDREKYGSPEPTSKGGSSTDADDEDEDEGTDREGDDEGDGSTEEDAATWVRPGGWAAIMVALAALM